MTHLDSILMRLEANHLRLTGGNGGQSFPSEIAAALREQAGEIERLKDGTGMTKLAAQRNEACAERDTLRAENSGLRKDAERYRHIRDRNSPLERFNYSTGVDNKTSCYHVVVEVRELKSGDELDAAIDAALANSPSSEWPLYSPM